MDNKGRIIIDDQFNTSVKNIKCIGDVTFGPMLAHKAEEEGESIFCSFGFEFRVSFPQSCVLPILVHSRVPSRSNATFFTGIAAVEYIKSGHGHVNYHAIPAVVYTHPEVAWVGKPEQELKADGMSFIFVPLTLSVLHFVSWYLVN